MNTSGLVLAALLGASAVLSGQAAAQAAAPAVVDPAAWGVYAQLIDTQATNEKYKHTSYAWRWDEAKTAIVEDLGEKWGSTRIVSLGGGKLARWADGRHVWTGTVEADGSVVWAPEGNFLTRVAGDPYRVRVEGTRIVYEYVHLKNGKVASAWPMQRLSDPQLGAKAAAPVAAASAAAAPNAVATTLPAAAPPTPAATPVAPASFGWLDTRIGLSFVGTRPEGGTYTLDVYREGDALALQTGTLGGDKHGRIVIRPTATAGRFELLETWHGGAPGESGMAYLVGSPGAPATDPLDGYFADPRAPGDLVLRYDIRGGYIVLVVHPNADTGGLSYYQHGGKRTLGVRRAVGDSNYVGLGWFSPASQAATNEAMAWSAAQQRQREEQRRADAEFEADIAAERQQKAMAWEQSRAASEQALSDSVARLNGTVAGVEAQQAQYRARQQAAEANAQRQRETDNAREAQRQQDAAAQAHIDAAPPSPTVRAPALTTTAQAVAPAAAAEAQALPKQMLGFCNGLQPGGFEGGKAVIYVSEIGPVDYTFGQPIEPLKSAYQARTGVPDLVVDCMVSTDRATLERKRQEAIDNRGYPDAKRVMTGL